MSIYTYMTRVIYSLYIDIPEDELDPQPPHHLDTEDKNIKAKREFAIHQPFLERSQRAYAANIGVEYRIFKYDDKWKQFKADQNKKYPVLNTYNIINFYKIHVMYELLKEFDEILYLDMDVISITRKNFFNEFDLDKGIVIQKNNLDYNMTISADDIRMHEKYAINNPGWKMSKSNRSPMAKFWNSKAIIMEEGGDPTDNLVYNTGIIGANKKHLEQLDYWGDFSYFINLMTELKEPDNGMWSFLFRDIFGWDNETLWGAKTNLNNVQCQLMPETWHHFMHRACYVPKGTFFIHIINKEFEWVREYCEKNNF